MILTNILPTDAKELREIPNLKSKTYYAEFTTSGRLIYMDTEDITIINFVKSKGLKWKYQKLHSLSPPLGL